jgi:hypothetical protein
MVNDIETDESVLRLQQTNKPGNHDRVPTGGIGNTAKNERLLVSSTQVIEVSIRLRPWESGLLRG